MTWLINKRTGKHHNRTRYNKKGEGLGRVYILYREKKRDWIRILILI